MAPTDPKNATAIILAAGEGTRMRSALPKVLHQVGHLPLIAHVMKAARAAGLDRPRLVLGHGGEAVRLNGEVVGSTASVAYGHSVGKILAFAYIKPHAATPGTELEIVIAGEPRAGRVLGRAHKPVRLHIAIGQGAEPRHIGPARHQLQALGEKRLHDIVRLIGQLARADRHMGFAIFQAKQPRVADQTYAQIRVPLLKQGHRRHQQWRQSAKGGHDQLPRHLVTAAFDAPGQLRELIIGLTGHR